MRFIMVKTKTPTTFRLLVLKNMICYGLYSYGTDIHFTKEINLRDITCM